MTGTAPKTTDFSGPNALQTWSLRLSCRSLYPFALIPFAQVPRAQRRATKVLDVPAGGGVLSCALKAAGFDVTAADLFPEYLSKGLAKYPQQSARPLFEAMTGAKLPDWLAGALLGPGGDAPAARDVPCVAADMEGRLPFDDATFDRVACLEGIEHVVDRHKTLRELRRVLRPGGKLLITTPNLMSLRARVAVTLQPNATAGVQTPLWCKKMRFWVFWHLRYSPNNGGFAFG